MFYVLQKDWTGAIHLRAGDMLVLSNGEYVVVEKVEHELLENPVKVYNFEVEDFHTYYVSEFGVLVHNVCHEKHHFASNKNKKFTPDFESIAQKYDLDGDWNIAKMKHRGRHPNRYHEWVLKEMKKIDSVADSADSFVALFMENIMDPVLNSHDMLRKWWWTK